MSDGWLNESDGSASRSDVPHAVTDSLLNSVLRTPELHDVLAEFGDATLDALVDNAAIDVIPVVGAIRGFVHGAGSIRDALLAKKLLAMLVALDEIPTRDLAKWRRRIEEDGGRETGERVLAVVDRATSTYKATLVGKVFGEYLGGHCDRAAFLRTVEMIDLALTEDLRFLIEDWRERDWDEHELDEVINTRLISIGLIRDRTNRIVAMSSRTPAPSVEGSLLRSAAAKGSASRVADDDR